MSRTALTNLTIQRLAAGIAAGALLAAGSGSAAAAQASDSVHSATGNAGHFTFHRELEGSNNRMVGEVVTYTTTITDNDGLAHGLGFSDTFPAGMKLVGGTLSQVSPDGTKTLVDDSPSTYDRPDVDEDFFQASFDVAQLWLSAGWKYEYELSYSLDPLKLQPGDVVSPRVSFHHRDHDWANSTSISGDWDPIGTEIHIVPGGGTGSSGFGS